MAKIPKMISAQFFQNDNGKEPVRDWLLSLSPADKKTIGEDIKTVEFGWPLGKPHVGTIGDGLYEVCSNVSDKRIARVLFMIYRNLMILLHGFIKKDQKIPKNDLRLAKNRMKKFLKGDLKGG